MIKCLLSVVAVIFLCGCTESNRQLQPPINRNKDSQAKMKTEDRPFMEHPSGDFKTAVEAMANAIERLRALPEWNNWITFSAQGMGNSTNSYHFAEIRMRQNEIKLKTQIDIDIELATKRAGVPQSYLSKKGDVYLITKSTPIQAARLLDDIFRQYLGIHSFPDEENDYAVGAEW
jgi:hypothetical protein